MKRILSLWLCSVLIGLFSVSVHAVTTVSFQDGVSPDPSYSGTEDAYVRESSPTTNYGSETVLLADGIDQDPDNGVYGEVATLLNWDISSIPTGVTIVSVTLTLEITNSSSGGYTIVEQESPWSENSVTWNDFFVSSPLVGSIPAGSLGITTVNLAPHFFQPYVDGTLEFLGIGIISRGSATGIPGPNDGIDMSSRESSSFKPKLEITYTVDPPSLEELFAMIQEMQGQLALLNQLKADLAGVKRIGDTIQFEGVNLQIVSGLGSTNGSDGINPDPVVNGLGNLIVGYNEVGLNGSDKTGSNNLIVGSGHSYPSFGGFVAGLDNIISGPLSSVLGGSRNVASGSLSSVSGGSINQAIGDSSSVNGGTNNHATGTLSSVNGGHSNQATGHTSTVSGGDHRTASGFNEWVAGSLSEPN